MNYSIVPPIVIRYEDGDELVHTDDHPFCSDPDCPDKSDPELFAEYIGGPLDRGELTMREALRLFFGRQV